MIAGQRWRIVLVYLCSWYIALAVGCKDTSNPDEGQDKRTVSVPRYGGTYHKPLRQEPLTLDPAFLTDVYAISVAHQVFNGLVQFDANLNVVPCIAKSWAGFARWVGVDLSFASGSDVSSRSGGACE